MFPPSPLIIKSFWMRLNLNNRRQRLTRYRSPNFKYIIAFRLTSFKVFVIAINLHRLLSIRCLRSLRCRVTGGHSHRPTGILDLQENTTRPFYWINADTTKQGNNWLVDFWISFFWQRLLRLVVAGLYQDTWRMAVKCLDGKFVKLLVCDINCNTESIEQNLFYCFSTRSIESVNFSFNL